jgi:hypothetical protein
MKIIMVLLIGLLFAGSLFAQETVRLKKTYTAPEIDGFVEDIWEQAKTYFISYPFKEEIPTIGQSTWQALYDNNYFYVVLFVDDDNHWPGWEAKGDSLLYDHPEIYWDVNEELKDGKGAKDTASGHYQFAKCFSETGYDIAHTVGKSGANPGGTYAYSLIGEGYVYELAVPLANFKNGAGNYFGRGYNTIIGFDITIFDQDEGVTTAPQRCVWANGGNGYNPSTNDCWNNMDGVGQVQLSYGGPTVAFSPYAVNLSAKSGSKAAVSVITSVPWNAVSTQSWLTVNPTSGNGEGTIILTAEENSGSARIGYINVTINNGSLSSIKVTQEGVVGNNTLADNPIKISPNPVTTQFTIQGGIDRVELYNSLGVKAKETPVSNRTVSVAGLPKGVYFMKAYKNGQVEGFAKIIKN